MKLDTPELISAEARAHAMIAQLVLFDASVGCPALTARHLEAMRSFVEAAKVLMLAFSAETSSCLGKLRFDYCKPTPHERDQAFAARALLLKQLGKSKLGGKSG